MIDEKLLIETMQWKMREAGTSDWNRCLDEVERFIREFPQVGGWIPVSERLPEERQDRYYPISLVTLDNGDVCLGVYRYDDKEWWTRMSEGETVYTTDHKVIAWQPLPEPYKESEGRRMTIEIDKNFETVLLCAVRYAIGRQTYIPSLVIDYITPLLPYLSENTLRLIANEITEHDAYEGGLGDEKIDKPYWLDFLRKIRLEIGGRYEP